MLEEGRPLLYYVSPSLIEGRGTKGEGYLTGSVRLRRARLSSVPWCHLDETTSPTASNADRLEGALPRCVLGITLEEIPHACLASNCFPVFFTAGSVAVSIVWH